MGVWRLAFRYLLSRRIAVISVLTIAVGVMAMIVVTSLMDGVETFLTDHLKGTRSDYTVVAREGFSGSAHWDRIRRELEPETQPGGPIAAFCPREEGRALIVPGDDPGPEDEERIRGVLLIGIDYPLERRTTAIERYLGAVENDALVVPEASRADALAVPVGDPYPRILLGDTLADELGVSRTGVGAGKTQLVTLVAGSLKRLDDGTVEFDGRDRVLRVAGCFSAGSEDFDRAIAYVDRSVLQSLRYETLGGRRDCKEVCVRLRDPELDEESRAALLERHPSLRFESWLKPNDPEMRALREQKQIMLVILFFIIAVSSMAILGIVHMMVVEKTRDIGILRSMGLSRARVIAVFTVYGGILGALGALLGTLAGLQVVGNLNEIVAWLSDLFGVDLLAAEVYRFKRIPTRTEVQGVALIVAAALAQSIIASLLPALKAGCMNPVRALRSE